MKFKITFAIGFCMSGASNTVYIFFFFQELMSRERVVWERWQSSVVYQMVFASGIIVMLTVNTSTGDLIRIVFDKFLVGKLLSEHLADGE